MWIIVWLLWRHVSCHPLRKKKSCHVLVSWQEVSIYLKSLFNGVSLRPLRPSLQRQVSPKRSGGGTQKGPPGSLSQLWKEEYDSVVKGICCSFKDPGSVPRTYTVAHNCFISTSRRFDEFWPYVCLHTCTNTHTHMRTRTHTYTYMHMYTYMHYT